MSSGSICLHDAEPCARASRWPDVISWTPSPIGEFTSVCTERLGAAVDDVLPSAQRELVFAPALFGQRLHLKLVLLDADLRAARHQRDLDVVLDRARFVEPAAAIDERVLLERLLQRCDRLRRHLLALERELPGRPPTLFR
jgi:hypothetical protein